MLEGEQIVNEASTIKSDLLSYLTSDEKRIRGTLFEKCLQIIVCSRRFIVGRSIKKKKNKIKLNLPCLESELDLTS